MNQTSIPRWVWWLCGGATLVAALFWLTSSSDEAPKPRELVSIYGDKLEYLDESSFTSTAHPRSLLIGMPVDKDAGDDVKEAKADALFAGYAGARAEELGYRHVLIRPDDGTGYGGISIFGFRLRMHVDIGAGPANDDDGLIEYDKSADGVWNKGGSSPTAPDHFDVIKLPSGTTFALTYSMAISPSGWLVYDCLTCRPDNAAHEFSQSIYSFLSDAVAHEPAMQGLSKAKIAVFLGTRHSTWEFPMLVKISIAKQNGSWKAPQMSTQRWQQLIQKYEQSLRTNARL